jgi:hypothetical protein
MNALIFKGIGQETKAVEGSTTIDTTKLASGVYVLKLSSETGRSQTLRFMIKP